ncbi:MAG: GNAT family N-acetyltransferase [Anaerolineae bacterium]|jgi:predicted GNAT superfamily acetyltransferase
MNVLIRPLESIAEFHACEALQRRVWVLPDDLEVVPLHLLLTAQRNGGLVLGAFDGGELVGFLFGFPAYDQDGRPKHCSHMMGVDPDCQGAGIGYQLKLAQREFALAQGLDLVTWTYDPLESRNAYLNIHKLGGVCRTYIRDYYGPLDDGLNSGLPTDRFQVDWWITGDRVERRLAGQVGERVGSSALIVNATGQTSDGLLTPGLLALDADQPSLQVETPTDYQAIKAADPALALEWRLAMRQVFEACFATGYTVVDFLSCRTGSGRRSFYILRAD